MSAPSQWFRNLTQSLSEKPNRHRILYDGIILLLGSIFISLYQLFFAENSVALAPLLLVIPVYTAINLLIGIYGRFAVGSGFVKAPLLGLSLLLSLAVPYFLGVPSNLLSILFAVSWPALSIPRILLNIDTRIPTNFVTKAVRQKGPILIVGGGGYIGTHLVDELLTNNHKVRVLDRLLYGKTPLADFLNHPNFELVEGDATDIARLTFAMAGASAVVHLGGLVGDPACAVDEAYTRHTNVIATRMVHELAISFGVERFVFASSCSVYGASDYKVDERSPLNPVSLYALTKIDSEKELLRTSGQGVCTTILRFATVFGHSRRPRFDLVANLFTAQAWEDGKITVIGPNQWRPFVHCRDLATAIHLVLKAPIKKVNGEVFNVGDESLNMTIGQLGEQVKNIVSKYKPVELQVTDNVTDRRNYMVSFDKIKNTLGFTANNHIENAIEEIVSHFKNKDYEHYKSPTYSNVEITKKAVMDFRDPMQSIRMYRPVSETPVGGES